MTISHILNNGLSDNALKNELDKLMGQVQLTDEGICHFIGVEGLSRTQLMAILHKANGYIIDDGINPNQGNMIATSDELRGKTVMNLFFENSTRTRTTFEVAAHRLGATVINLDIAKSSTSKGENLSDTLHNLGSMNADMFVVRHSCSGTPYFMAQNVCPHIAVINAGDGTHAHPTQAMLDMLTIYRQCPKDFEQLSVVIIGDIKHSRVARSDISALQTLGVPDIRVVAPKTLLPVDIEAFGVNVYDDAAKAIAGVDVIITLRIQNERIGSPLLPSTGEYAKNFGINRSRLALAPNAIVMHPGPINRGVEISSEVADGTQSVILKQVNNGIAVRMAVMAMAMAGQNQKLHCQS